MADWSIPKRYVGLSLYKGSEGEQNADNELARADVNVNISFSTSAAVYGMSPEANISITGLKPDKMAYLATSYNAYAKNRIYNSLRIDAGYDNKHGIIYTGTIIEAVPDLNSPDYTINLKCMSYWNYNKNEIISLTYDKETSLKKICQDLADKMSVLLKYDVKEDITLSDCAFNGNNPVNIMRDIANAANVNIWLEATQSSKGTMFVTKQDEGRTDKDVFKIDKFNLIGAPCPTAIGCEVDIRMDSSIQAGIKVRIDSLKFPVLNSLDYFVNSFYHSGQTKGNKWTTHLSLTREKLYAK